MSDAYVCILLHLKLQTYKSFSAAAVTAGSANDDEYDNTLAFSI